MTTCLDCGFNHVLNLFLVEPDEGADDITDLVMECPNCGSDNCVKDSEAKKEGHDSDTLGNVFELVEAIATEDSGNDSKGENA